VGGNAQIKGMKKVAGMLRLDLAQFRELEAFAKFGSDLDKNTLAQLTRGQRMVEILKQGQYSPVDVAKQVTIIWAVNNGSLDDIPLNKVADYEKSFYSFIEANYSEIFDEITNTGAMSEESEKALLKGLNEFKSGFSIE
jgi:F-type H+-transporting ATPase subunit alpha